MVGFDKKNDADSAHEANAAWRLLTGTWKRMALNLVMSSQSPRQTRRKFHAYHKADGLVEQNKLQCELSLMNMELGEDPNKIVLRVGTNMNAQAGLGVTSTEDVIVDTVNTGLSDEFDTSRQPLDAEENISRSRLIKNIFAVGWEACKYKMKHGEYRTTSGDH